MWQVVYYRLWYTSYWHQQWWRPLIFTHHKQNVPWHLLQVLVHKILASALMVCLNFHTSQADCTMKQNLCSQALQTQLSHENTSKKAGLQFHTQHIQQRTQPSQNSQLIHNWQKHFQTSHTTHSTQPSQNSQLIHNWQKHFQTYSKTRIRE